VIVVGCANHPACCCRDLQTGTPADRDANDPGPSVAEEA